jgi:hypothetical protein
MKEIPGKPVTNTPLPDPEHLDEILIREGAASNEPEEVADARARVQAELSEEGDDVGPNPIVKRTLEKLDKTKAGRDGLIRSDGDSFVRVAVRPESLERASEILEQLVAQAERAGLSLTRSEGAAAWLCDGEMVEFELAEAPDQVEHIATEKELAAVAKWQREREDYHRRYGYWKDWGEPKIPKWEQRYQGRLSIKLEDVRIKRDDYWWGKPMRRTFAESRTRQLTKAMPRIISTIAAMAAAKRHNLEFDARRRAAEEEAARQRAAAERRRQLEQKAVTVLDNYLMSKLVCSDCGHLLIRYRRWRRTFRKERDGCWFGQGQGSIGLRPVSVLRNWSNALLLPVCSMKKVTRKQRKSAKMLHSVRLVQCELGRLGNSLQIG